MAGAAARHAASAPCAGELGANSRLLRLLLAYRAQVSRSAVHGACARPRLTTLPALAAPGPVQHCFDRFRRHQARLSAAEGRRHGTGRTTAAAAAARRFCLHRPASPPPGAALHLWSHAGQAGMATQVQYAAHGDSSVLRLVTDQPVPGRKRGHVLVDNRATSVNPVDYKVRPTGVFDAFSF